MIYYSSKSLNNIFKVAVLTLLMSLSFYSICFSQGKSESRLDRLMQELKDEDWRIRNRAAETLASIGTPAVGHLIVALNDKSPYVRREAADALGKIKDARAVEPLIAALKDGDRYFRWRAAEALASIGAPAVEPLIVALKDEDRYARGNAAYALKKLKNARAVEPLIVALNDEDLYVRSNAVEALVEINNARAVEPLIAALKDENLEIIKSAHSFFIKRGASGSEALLIMALNKYGNQYMALDFANCGNSKLEEAGKKWAEEHGYKINSGPGHGSPRWGRQ